MDTIAFFKAHCYLIYLTHYLDRAVKLPGAVISNLSWFSHSGVIWTSLTIKYISQMLSKIYFDLIATCLNISMVIIWMYTTGIQFGVIYWSRSAFEF